MAGSIASLDVGPAFPVANLGESSKSWLAGASRAVLELDTSGRIRAAKGGFCSLLGYQASDLVGRYHGDIISAYEGEGPCYAEFWRLIGGGETVGMEYGFRTRDGREIRLTALYSPEVDGSGHLVGFSMFALTMPRTEHDA